MTKILHISATPVTNASRLFKEAAAACARGMSVQALGLGDPGLQKFEVRSCGTEIERVRLWSRGLPKSLPFQLLKYKEWAFRLLIKIIARRPDIIHCHSLSTLMIGVLGKWFGGARLLYDAHELETERNGLHGLRQKLARRLERQLIRFADHTIVVGPRIMDWYEKKYPGLRVSCVRNVPDTKHAEDRAGEGVLDVRAAIGAAEADVILLYLGGLIPGRGIEFLCETFCSSAATEDLSKYHMVFVGYGSHVAYIEEFAERAANIHYLSAVAPGDVVATARSADIGVCLLSSTVLSYRYALPNKLFEYVCAGIPVIVNDDYPEMADFVRRYDCGWRIPLSSWAFLDLLQKMTPEQVEKTRAGAAKAAIENDWSTEAATLMRIYDELLEN